MILAAKAIGSFLKKIPWQIYVCTGLALAFWGWGEWQYRQGQGEIQAKWDASTEKGRGILAQMKRDYESLPPAVVTLYKTKTEVIYEKGETLIKRIPEYIPAGTCDLPGGFRLLHDAAVTQSSPEAAGGTEAKPVPVADATSTIIGNYTTCQVEHEKLVAMWAWADQVQQKYRELCEQEGIKCVEE